jgi:hypothetical protein
MNTFFALLGLVVTVHGGAVSLTNGNFDDLVYNSGKNAFVQFQAPW